MRNTYRGLKGVLLLVLVLALAVLFLATKPAAAGTDRHEFEAYNLACTMVSQERMWTRDDGIVHVQNRVLQSVVQSDSSYHNGTGQITSSVNMFPNGYLTYHGTLEIYPAAYPDNHWAGHFTIQINETGAGGIARLNGYGPELDGLLVKADLTPLPPAVLAGFLVCPGATAPIAGVRSQGVVMFPGGE
jgi:hypothetical protein